MQARATARVDELLHARPKPYGLTAEQFSPLVGIGATREASVGSWAASAGVDASMLSRNVQNLERGGLLCVDGCRGRGGKQLALSDIGRDLMVRALPFWDAARAGLSGRFGEEKLQSPRRVMCEPAKAADTSPLLAAHS